LGISGALVVQALLAASFKVETNGRSLEAIALQESDPAEVTASAPPLAR
jgi:hypothetical protein